MAFVAGRIEMSVLLARHGEGSRGVGRGMAGVRRKGAVTCGLPSANGARRCARPVCAGTARGTGLGVGVRHSYPEIVLPTRASVRWSLQHLGMRARTVATVVDVASRLATSQRGRVHGLEKPFRVALFATCFLQFFKLKCTMS
jgi:hypothetical protein